MATDSKDTSSLARDLQEVGFTDYEARVYIALLHASPATAYEISKLNALPRPNVYSSLESLEKKGAVQRVSSDPVRVVPIDPKVLLERISRTMSDRCSSLKERLEQLKGVEETNYVWNLSSLSEAQHKIGEIIAGARRHVWIKAHHAALDVHVDALRAAADRGVSVLLIMFGEANEIDSFRSLHKAIVYAHEGDGTVVGLARHLVTLTVDFEETLIFNIREESGAYTRSSPVVNMADSLIRHEIYLAEIFSRLGPQLDEHFGPALLNLRKKYLPADQARALERRLQRSVA
ncbi:MAG: helix-turn-helix domain-containing protein [Pseudomonadota bacterium]